MLPSFFRHLRLAQEDTMQKPFYFILGLFLPILMAITALAQPPAGNGVPAHVLVTVEARHGNDVPLITKDDVMVYEGKDRDAVIDWVPAQGDHAGLELFVLLDDGSNISLGSQLQDISEFIKAQPPSTKIGIAYMRDGIARVEQNLTSDHDQAAKALRLPIGEPGVNASPYFSLSDLIKRWPQSNDRREVLMVTDGIDRYYGSYDLEDPYVGNTIDDAQRAGIVVFPIYTPGVGHFGHSYWQTYWGQLYLSQVAGATGGESYYIGFTGSPVSFVPYLDNLTHRLTHQYFLTFSAKPPKKAGFQKVKVTTEVTNADLVAPSRVYVAAEP
jgi:hypothetical protein